MVTIETFENQLTDVTIGLMGTETDSVQQTEMLRDMISTYFTSVAVLIVSDEANVSEEVSCLSLQ